MEHDTFFAISHIYDDVELREDPRFCDLERLVDDAERLNLDCGLRLCEHNNEYNSDLKCFPLSVYVMKLVELLTYMRRLVVANTK